MFRLLTQHAQVPQCLVGDPSQNMSSPLRVKGFCRFLSSIQTVWAVSHRLVLEGCLNHSSRLKKEKETFVSTPPDDGSWCSLVICIMTLTSGCKKASQHGGTCFVSLLQWFRQAGHRPYQVLCCFTVTLSARRDDSQRRGGFDVPRDTFGQDSEKRKKEKKRKGNRRLWSSPTGPFKVMFDRIVRWRGHFSAESERIIAELIRNNICWFIPQQCALADFSYCPLIYVFWYFYCSWIQFNDEEIAIFLSYPETDRSYSSFVDVTHFPTGLVRLVPDFVIQS